ncbi:MAG TPA: flavin reductase family protein [Aggregatilineales bacterium]|nr:flavin reductase family protein [Anaerolineales bacterium]HRE49317.1 flavin reductase family protein [Aggregatilineales bacterium]
MPVESQVLRAAMRQWATGVTVVTTYHQGALAGMTVSSFTSVALEPPTVLVCLNKDTYAHALVRQSGVYAISMLGQGQEALSNRFAGIDKTITDRFAGIAYTTAETGSPLLAGAIAWFDCAVVNSIETGTHTIFIAEVIAAHSEPDLAPLLYHNRTYKRLVPTAEEGTG